MIDDHILKVSYKYDFKHKLVTSKPSFECMCHDDSFVCEHIYDYQLAKEVYFAKLEAFQYPPITREEYYDSNLGPI